MVPVAQLRVLAASQHGVVSREQARSLGLTGAALAHETRRSWIALTPRVLQLNGTSRTWMQRAFAAVLDAGTGAVLSHHSAAELWGIPGYRLDGMHVSRPRGGSRTPGRIAVVHEPYVLPFAHITIGGSNLPVTTPARTVFDLAAVVRPYRLERTLENAWSRRLLDGHQMARVLDDLGKRGRKGTTAIRLLLRSRGATYVPPESGLEARFMDVLRRAGERPMRRQVNVGGARWIGRVDFLDPELPVVVQIDSSFFHGSLTDQDADARQTEDLEAAGFEVVRLTDHHVWYDAEHVVNALRAARSRARKRASSSGFTRENGVGDAISA
jgi:very-short-patch-repair endonuclease